jgi:lichenan operon transcriptional antiterminator
MIALDILYELKDHASLSCASLAERIGTSPTKIRKAIIQINEDLPETTAKITSRKGSGNGYTLKIFDKEAFYEYLIGLEEDNYVKTNDLHNLLSRTQNIALYLLNLDDYIRLDDLSEIFYVSSRQMSDDLKNVRKLLDNYNLKIVNKPYHGLKVEGKEFDKRICIANIYFKNVFAGDRKDHSMMDALIDKRMNLIKKILEEEAQNAHVQLSDIALENMVIHIFVMMNRSKTQNECIDTKMSSEDVFSNRIIERLEKEFELQLSEYDKEYLRIHAASKRSYQEDELIDEEIQELAKEILKKIDEKFLTNYVLDQQLIIRLCLHLIPLVIRIKNHLVSNNPMAETIKDRYKISNEMACVAALVINERYNVQLSQDEISNIALHLELSSYTSKFKKYKILLLCHTGTASSEILKQQIINRYGDYILQMDTSSVNGVSQYDLDSYTFILSTVPFRAFTGTPIYKIDSFLDEDSLEEVNEIMQNGTYREDISKYFPKELFITGIMAKSKEEVLKQIVEIISKHKQISSHFYESVLERENLSSTDYGNLVAIPHPFRKMSEEAFSSVAVLKEPVHWGNNDVQVVITSSISDESKGLQTYYYLLTKTISSKSKMKKLIKEPNYEYFLKLLNER